MMKYSKENLIGSGRRFTPDDFIFFWGHTGSWQKIGKFCLSQWYPAPFVADGDYYNCAEQYMMAQKALIFGDEEIHRQIMEAYEPQVVKKLGRRVRNFNDFVWHSNRFDVVVKANIAKFSQNDRLREYLLSTADKILVEASPKDTVWGIGMAESAPDACNPALWRGENLLGFALMTVRDILRGKDSENEKEDPANAMSMWSLGAGNSARRFNMEDPIPQKKEKASADSWQNRPLSVYMTVPQNYFITAKQMAVIKQGHIPDAMEDHWFMYCDENTIRYYRSWTGICFVHAVYEPYEDGYRITELRINNKPDEYELNDVDEAVTLFYALLISEYGGYSAPYWKAIF